MMKLSKEKRDQLILIGMLTALSCAALWYFVAGAQTAALADRSKKLDDINRKLDAARALVKRADKVSAELQVAQAKLSEIEATMAPAGNEYTFLFNLLKDAVANTKIQFAGDLSQPTITETDLLPGFPYKSASFVTVLFGRYHQFGTFLAGLESRYPYMRFELISVRHPDTVRPEDPEQLRFETRIITLVQSDVTK